MSVEVTSKMAGRIAEIGVSQGQTVYAGQEIMVLESMKMHIPIATPAAGVVEAINVRVGDSVKGDQPLAVIRQATVI